jgi:hypothetical protein
MHPFKPPPTERDPLDHPELIIRPQTEEEEFEWLKRILLERMPFYKEHGYTVHVPDHVMVRGTIEDPSTFDEKKLRMLHKEELYDPSIFEQRIRVLEEERETFDRVFKAFQEMNAGWGFKIFQKYEIFLSRYGVGGSYLASLDTRRARAILLLKEKGGDGRMSPAETPTHEWVHCGVIPFVEQYHLTHPEKERLVDLICLHILSDILDGYTVLSEPSAIDPYILNHLGDIPQALTEYRKAQR